MYKIQMKINNTKEIGNKMEKIKCSNLFVKIGLNVHIYQKKDMELINYLGQSVTGVESVPRDEQCDPCATEYY